MDLETKANTINLVLSKPEVNLWELRELALTEGGLVNDTLRKRAWPKLVGLHDYYAESLIRTKGVTSPSSNLPPIRPQRTKIQPTSLPPKPPLAPSQSAPSLSPLAAAAAAAAAPSSQETLPDGGSLETISSPRRTSTIPACDDAEQIDRDVARCTWHLLIGSQRSRRLQMKNKHRKKMASVLRKKQRRLGSLINLSLVRSYQTMKGDDKLYYYQGYHDVASIFLSALGGGGPSQTFQEGADSVEYIAASLGLDLPSRVLVEVSKTHLRDALKSNFLQLQTMLKLVLMPLIWYFDPEVHAHLLECDMEPFFALSWVITWFSHDIRDTELVKRLFDAFLVSHPLLPIYMTVAMVCHPYNRMEILSTECDFAMIHQALAGLPKNSCMVGWKYKVGDGYVSGDEEDEGTATTDMDTSFASEDMMDRELEGRDDDDESNSLQSLIAGPLNVGSKTPKAPFQDLINIALGYMRRVPPRALLGLSNRYYTVDAIHPMMEMAPSIIMLRSAPKSSVVFSCTSDWVLKQRQTGRRLSRRDRRQLNRSRSPGRSRSRERSFSRERSVSRERYESRERQVSVEKTRSTDKTNDESPAVDRNTDSQIELYLKERNQYLPVIACGYGGPSDDEIIGKKRKRRRLLIAGIVVIAVAIGVVYVASSRYSELPDEPAASRIQRDLSSGGEVGLSIDGRDQGQRETQAAIGADGSIVYSKETVTKPEGMPMKEQMTSEGSTMGPLLGATSARSPDIEKKPTVLRAESTIEPFAVKSQATMTPKTAASASAGPQESFVEEKQVSSYQNSAVQSGLHIIDDVLKQTKRVFLMIVQTSQDDTKFGGGVIFGVRKRLTGNILPKSVELFRENFFLPLRDNILPASRKILTQFYESGKALHSDGIKIAKEAIKEDDFVL